ncbi:MAG TPA: winged helix-turn-helix domain-containing protein [Opitutaceae bacterium]|jgi:two-component system KDP operon response regulator KdpE|nr:winged helix-turn-helix domain-containing protein [Opitutaceae bacterium]
MGAGVKGLSPAPFSFLAPGGGAEDSTHYLRVQMTHLRKKLEPEPQRPRYLKTESGIGYRLADG